MLEVNIKKRKKIFQSFTVHLCDFDHLGKAVYSYGENEAKKGKEIKKQKFLSQFV